MTVPNHRPVPLLALWLDVPPGEVVSAQLGTPAAARSSRPASARVATDYVLDPRDADRRIAPVPPGFEPVAANASWRVATRC